jgi:serine/threonine protein kinase HipA of HipAB toxin-antitoxin module
MGLHIDSTVSMSPRLVRSVSELNAAVKEFKENYESFVKKHRQYHDLLIDDDFNHVFQNTRAHSDIKSTAETFGEKIKVALRAVESRNKITANKWTTRLGSFLKTLLPVANLSVNLAGALGEV